MANAYVDLATFKGSGVLNITGTGQDVALRELLERVSRAVDRASNRHFYVLAATRLFDTDSDGRDLGVPDLVSIDTNGLKTDDNRDRTFETTWAATDCLLEPANADPATAANSTSRPYTQVVVDTDAGGKTAFSIGRRTVQIAGQWGFWQHATDSGDTVQDNPLSAAATTLNVSDGTKFAVGQTLLIESDQSYITAIAANALTVRRGLNGTTAASHVQSTAISVFEYPAEVVQATIIQAARWWRRKDAAYGNQIGLPQVGRATAASGVDPDVAHMLYPFVRLPVGV